MLGLFVTYRQAEALKKLGFNDKSLAYFDPNFNHKTHPFNWNKAGDLSKTSAPLNQQSIQYLQESIGGLVSIEYFSYGSGSWHFEDKKVNFKTIPHAINLGIEHLQFVLQNTLK